MIYQGNDYRNYLSHYGRKGMRKGKHLPGTTWWKDLSIGGARDYATMASNYVSLANRINKTLKANQAANVQKPTTSAVAKPQTPATAVDTKSQSKQDAAKKADEDKIVRDTIDGKYGNGETRRKNLEKAGYSYEHIQNKVNESLGSSKRHEEPKTETKTDSQKPKTVAATPVKAVSPEKKKAGQNFVLKAISGGIKTLRSVGSKAVSSGKNFISGLTGKGRKSSSKLSRESFSAHSQTRRDAVKTRHMYDSAKRAMQKKQYGKAKHYRSRNKLNARSLTKSIDNYYDTRGIVRTPR